MRFAEKPKGGFPCPPKNPPKVVYTKKRILVYSFLFTWTIYEVYYVYRQVRSIPC